jgi:hypothetical protein
MRVPVHFFVLAGRLRAYIKGERTILAVPVPTSPAIVKSDVQRKLELRQAGTCRFRQLCACEASVYLA